MKKTIVASEFSPDEIELLDRYCKKVNRSRRNAVRQITVKKLRESNDS